MAATFYTLLTKQGLAAVANATALNTPVNLTKMAVGDGGGAATTPKETQTALVAQKYSANLNQLTIDTSNPNYLIAEMIIPTTVGGWYVREVGIFDSAGNLFAIANFPETYKPQLAEGSGRDLVIRIVIQVSNASAVTLQVDPAVTLASQAWVTANFVAKSKVSGGAVGQVLAKSSATEQDYGWKNPTDLIETASLTKKGIVQLSSTVENNATKAATPAAVMNAQSATLSETDKRYLSIGNQLIELLNLGATAQANARYNIGCGTAAVKNVGVSAGNIPDMSSFASLQTASGYQQLPGGLIIQWVNASAPDGATSGSVNLPMAFPNQTLLAIICDSITTGSPGSFNLAWSMNSTTKNAVSWVSTAAGVGAFTILAIGR